MRPRSSTLVNLALVAATVAGLGLWALREPAPAGVLIEARDPAPGIDELRVDVAGAVARPGVVTIAPGERLADALERAGGALPEADTSALNLSRRLVDQDHIVVPRQGERSPLLDVNRASARELEALPGIGPVYASRVVEARPFADTDELVERDVLPRRVYEGIRDLIAALPPEAAR